MTESRESNRGYEPIEVKPTMTENPDIVARQTRSMSASEIISGKRIYSFDMESYENWKRMMSL